jgi:transcriptional regulator EpsA
MKDAESTTPDLHPIPSPAEESALLSIASSAHKIRTEEDFTQWMRTRVTQFFPHEMMIFGTGSLRGTEIRIERLRSYGYPKAYFEALASKADLLQRPVLQRLFAENRPQIVDGNDVNKLLSPLEQKEVQELGLANIAAYGVIDTSLGRGTYFSFSRIPGRLSSRHARLLEMLVPYLHYALMKTRHEAASTANFASEQIGRLTPKEKEVLMLLGAGFSNREIATRMSRSELTIQTHVHSLLRKLNVPNRAAASALLHTLPFGTAAVRGERGTFYPPIIPSRPKP